MNLERDQKLLWLKLLSVVVLFFLTCHIGLYHTSHRFRTLALWWYSTEAQAVTQGGTILGVSDQRLDDIISVNHQIDSVLTEVYGLKSRWIENDRVEFENLNYYRKTVMIPRNFSGNMFNLDLTQLMSEQGWEVLNFREKMKSGDLHIDVGQHNAIFLRIDLNTNINLSPHGKEVYMLIEGFGASYDDAVRSWIALNENLTFVVTKNLRYTDQITEDAKKSGKNVIRQAPWSTKQYFFDQPDEPSQIRQALWENLELAPQRAFLIGTSKPATFQVLKDELPRLIKRGYRIRRYTGWGG